MYNLFFQLLRVAIGKDYKLNTTPSTEEWQQLFDKAMSHTVTGVCFAGIKRLPKEQRPHQKVFYQWLGTVLQIQKQNELMDKRTAQVWRMLKEAGLDAAVLKGQGIASEYVITDSVVSTDVEGYTEITAKTNLTPLRQSGDIDMWVLGGYQKVCDFVQSIAPTTDLAYHRFHFNIFRDTEVELHHRPTLMRNLMDDHKLARWYNSFKAEDFIYLEDKGFAIPPPSFNRIFILTHIYRHFLFEGIGLRQVMDYYFVLRGQANNTESTEKMLKHLRLRRFAEAIMWILHTQFGLEERYLICAINEKEGRFVLDEILTTGNFGHADHRYHYKHLRKLRKKIAHGTHLLLHYPSEVIWTPIWLVYHHYWKKKHINAIIRTRK